MSKRAADRSVLLLEILLNEPTSERAIAAIARMNYLHRLYQRSGKVRDSDMLYALSAFVLEPRRWIREFEWRAMTAVEVCACATYWKAMGGAMEISYEVLPSHKSGWRDGLHWLRELEDWSMQYEDACMVPAESNHRLAAAHLDLMFANLPSFLATVGRNLAVALLEPKLRTALKSVTSRPADSSILLTVVLRFSESPLVYRLLVGSFLRARKLCLRYLGLPRPELRRRQFIPSKPDSSGSHFNAIDYLSHPWYVKPTFWQRLGPGAWLNRVLGRTLPGDNGNRYAPEGYLIAELGPPALRGKGHGDMASMKERLGAERRGSCPFA